MATVELHPECLRKDLGGIREEKVREGIIDKIAILVNHQGFGKPLKGQLNGHHRLTYGRYRIVYQWSQPRDHILVWYVGLRNEELYGMIESVARRRAILEP